MKNDSDREFESLLQSALSRGLTPDEGECVQKLIREVPDRMTIWVDHFQLDAMLTDELDPSSVVDLVDMVCAEAAGEPPKPNGIVPAESDSDAFLASALLKTVRFWLSSAAAIFMLGTVYWWATDDVSMVNETSSPIDRVAMLVQTSDDVWEQGHAPSLQIQPGPVRLVSGLAELRIYNGVSLFLEGPVDLELISLELAHLHSGKLRAHVPDGAEGFTITTDSVRLVDRGTEFAVEAQTDGVAKVHVFDGFVDLYPTDEKSSNDDRKQALVQGDSVEIRPGFHTKKTALNLGHFPSASSIDDSVANDFERWLRWSREFSKRPDLFVHFNFEDSDERVLGRGGLTNLAASQGANVKANIVGCEVLTGRWPQKRALGFYRSGDRIRIRVPGRFPELTLACWARIDEIRGENQALLLTDNFDDWHPHWQISVDGDLRLGIGQPDRLRKRSLRSESTPLLQFAKLGRWTHLATTYDSNTRTVRHYVNGRQTGANRLPHAEPLRIGPAEIGNWLRPRKTGDEPIRNLDGRIDEFMLLRSALDAETIQEMYEAGR